MVNTFWGLTFGSPRDNVVTTEGLNLDAIGRRLKTPYLDAVGRRLSLVTTYGD